MSTCADCGKTIDMLEASYCSRGPAGIVVKHYHTFCGDPFGLKAKDAEIERLQELLRGVGANRYWEGRWRDEKAENERLRAALQSISNSGGGYGEPNLAAMAEDALEQRSADASAEGEDRRRPAGDNNGAQRSPRTYLDREGHIRRIGDGAPDDPSRAAPGQDAEDRKWT